MRKSALRSLPTRVQRRLDVERRSFVERRFRPTVNFDPKAPALFLSPHSDDAVLSAWGLLTTEPGLRVATVFAGLPEAGVLTRWDAVTGATESLARAREREAEDDAALTLAGKQTVRLPLLDGEYREPAPPYSLTALDQAVAQAFPRLSAVYAPAGIGGNQDHQLVRWYARMLLRAGLEVHLYADFPYCVQHGWPAWVDGRTRDPNRNVDIFWSSFLAPVPEMPPLRDATVTRLDDAQAAAKLAALDCYASQLTALSPGGRDLLRDPEIHRYEARWHLRPR
jgi:LmbE family N-acetylglucosaminyl deacetylase